MTTTGSIITFTTAHVSTGRLRFILPSSRVSSFTVYPRQRILSSRVRCALFPQTPPPASRRLVSLSLVLLTFLPLRTDAMAATIFDKYVKKKKLDPLEAYVPAVILTELQIKELGKNLEVDKPQYSDCRTLLRSGPASSLRVNIRAVAQYASDAGNGKSAFSEVDQCLRALEELDSLLLHASRNDSDASVEAMKVEVNAALNALNSLLKTVPADVLDKGKAMAEAYISPGEDLAPDDLDPQLKQLESIL